MDSAVCPADELIIINESVLSKPEKVLSNFLTSVWGLNHPLRLAFSETRISCVILYCSFSFLLFFFAHFKAQAEERAAMLRAQLEERKKAILQRINKEGKDKLEKVLNLLIASFFISLLENVFHH